MDYKFICDTNTNPYFNLAKEEYLLKQTKDYYISLWINEPAVIVGINQNTVEEVNLSALDEYNVKVVRRLTGGGAVYHDLGNICYTVISKYDGIKNYYTEFTTPVIEFLKTLGINAEFSGRNDIVVDGKKISGNAQTVFGDRIMHHGTLLFDTNPEILTKVLKVNKLKVESKGIKSFRSRVENIKNMLKTDMTTKEFFDKLCKFMKKDFDEYKLSENDKKAINKLVEEKYSTYSWNIGYSPKCTNTFKEKFSFGIFNLDFDVFEGKMKNVNVSGDFFSIKDIKEFAKSLEDVKYEYKELEKKFIKISEYIVTANGKEILDKMFN